MANCNKSRTTITAQLVPPGTELVNTYIVTIVQKLCSQICLNNADVVSNVNFGTPTIDVIDAATGIYSINIPVTGMITYAPLNAGNCCSKTEMISSYISVPVTSSVGIASVTIADGSLTENPLGGKTCGCNSTNLYEIQTSIIVTATVA